MNTAKNYANPAPILRFLVLIPHRDSGRLMDEYRRKLFAAGFAGALSFPAVSPLAILSRPFSQDELKEAARAIREISLDGGGKLSAEGTAQTPWLEHAQKIPLMGKDHFLFGPELKPHEGEAAGRAAGQDVGQEAGQVQDAFAEKIFAENPKIICRFPKIILCTAMIGPSFYVPGAEIPMDFPESPVLNFRAAMIANLSVRTLPGAPYSLEWKMRPAVWLPAVRERKQKAEK